MTDVTDQHVVDVAALQGIRIAMDGDIWCAVVVHGFRNMAEHHAGFGDTPTAAWQELRHTMDASAVKKLKKAGRASEEAVHRANELLESTRATLAKSRAANEECKRMVVLHLNDYRRASAELDDALQGREHWSRIVAAARAVSACWRKCVKGGNPSLESFTQEDIDWINGNMKALLYEVGTMIPVPPAAGERVALAMLVKEVRALLEAPDVDREDRAMYLGKAFDVYAQFLCDECDGSGRYFIDGKEQACICSESQVDEEPVYRLENKVLDGKGIEFRDQVSKMICDCRAQGYSFEEIAKAAGLTVGEFFFPSGPGATMETCSTCDMPKASVKLWYCPKCDPKALRAAEALGGFSIGGHGTGKGEDLKVDGETMAKVAAGDDDVKARECYGIDISEKGDESYLVMYVDGRPHAHYKRIMPPTDEKERAAIIDGNALIRRVLRATADSLKTAIAINEEKPGLMSHRKREDNTEAYSLAMCEVEAAVKVWEEAGCPDPAWEPAEFKEG